MSSTDFGKGGVFDTTKMAYDITGTPRHQETAYFPMGVASKDLTPFGVEEPITTPVKKEVVKTEVKVTVPAGSKVEIQPNSDAHVTAAQAIGLDPMTQ